MLTSAVLGTDSQKISILMSPTVVCSVTDMASDKQSSCFSPLCCLLSFNGLEEEHPKGLSALWEPMRPRGGLCGVGGGVLPCAWPWRSTTQSTGQFSA